MVHRPIKEIEEELRAAVAAQEEEKAAVKQVRPEYAFVFYPTYLRYVIYDNTCRVYTLARVLVNKEEVQADLYHKVRQVDYLYNTLTSSFVVKLKGDLFFVGNRGVWHELSEFIKYSPGGGTVSDIVNNYIPPEYDKSE